MFKKIAVFLMVSIVWVLSGYINYGYTLGYFTHKYPWSDNRSTALVMATGGPFALPATYLGNSPKHWLTTPLTIEQRWEAFHERWPILDRAYFERSEN